MSTLQSVLAHINTTSTKAPDAKAEAEKKKKQAAAAKAKKEAAKSGAAEDAKAKAKGSLKGSANGYSVAPKAATTANVLIASTALGAAPPDPTTAPLGKRLKDVLDALLARCGSQVSVPELKEATGHNLATDAELLREVHKHPRIKHAGLPPPVAAAGGAGATTQPPAAWYGYRPEIDGVYDKISMLNYVRDLKGRAALADQLIKCYKGAADDLAALKKENKVFVIGHPEPGKDTVFECNMMSQPVVSSEVRDLWYEVCQEHISNRLPADELELQAAVVKAGLRSALAHQPVKRVAPTGPKEKKKKPRKQRFNLDKATNAHLPSLFSGAQPKNIDS